MTKSELCAIQDNIKIERGIGRDAIIQLALGLQWRIVHISAEVVSKNIKELEKLLNQLATPGQK